MANLKDVEGIGQIYASKLQKVGIATTDVLLQKGAKPSGRKEIAEKSGISRKLILEWVNLVDLFRINGVQEEYSDLLEECGVDTVVELATRNSARLYEKLAIVNEEDNLVNKLPGEAQVANWINEAKTLPRVVEY